MGEKFKQTGESPGGGGFESIGELKMKNMKKLNQKQQPNLK